MSEGDEHSKDVESDKLDDDKENLDDSRANSSMANSTFVTTGRIHNEKADVSDDGTLDLANLSLTNLDRNFIAEYARVRRLIISGNCFQKFTYMKLFPKCQILDSCDCQISKFIADFNYNLVELYLARNQLKDINQFSRFENLKILDLSSNVIDGEIGLSLKNMEVLNLSGNYLTSFPDLSKCTSLRSLNLAENKISNLTKMALLIPSDLSSFDISSNLIDDLSQFSQMSSYKAMAHLAVAGNPCINEVIDKDLFDYRSYIIACCSEQLLTVDYKKIEDNIQTEGEWLALQGGIKKICPGNHKQLCEQIASHFPKADSGPPTPAQKSCHKALEKRRSMIVDQEEMEKIGQDQEKLRAMLNESSQSVTSNDTDRTVSSVYSPFREWTGKIGRFAASGRFINWNRSNPINKNLRMCSPPESRKNKSFTFQTESSPSSSVEHRQFQPLNESRTNSTETVICSARTEVNFTVDGRSESTPLPIIEDCTTPVKSGKHEGRPECLTVSASDDITRNTPSVADVTFVTEENEELRQRVHQLELNVCELKKQNENLTAINDGLVGTLENFKIEQSKMWLAIRNLIPTPQNVTNSLIGEMEEGNHVHQIRWEMPLVKEYQIFVDGNRCGKIIGKNNSARITDLTANEAHCIQIQAVGNNGLKGELSKPLHINPK